eukprot:m.221881 g.221881  ORF g.221881 m.221881 type:complete len:651 (+) comp33356_c7_seq1:26-1978(+)
MMDVVWVITLAICSVSIASSSSSRVPPPLSQCTSGTVVHNNSGCTTAGHFAETAAVSAADCCAQCSNFSQCVSWTFHAPNKCDLGSSAGVKIGVPNATCGCRFPGCGQGPPPPPVQCEPVYRPPKPTLVPLPAGKTKPHLVSVLVDDLGFDDAVIRRDNGRSHTPYMAALVKDGILLDRHHTYLWCSPTRRAFLTGRYPAHITGTQAPTCSNLTPLQFTTLSEKLAAAGYESHFVGKGHLGYQTTDHLPFNRGFTSHLGFLGGGEAYTYGEQSRCGDGGKADMWLNDGPAVESVKQDYYTTNYFSDYSVQMIQQRNTSKPFWLHLTYQAVHTGAGRSPPVWERWDGDADYISATYVLDNGIGNITAAFKAANMWENMVFMVTADNGGDCGLPLDNQPGYASNYPLLGRKCTAWDGGTRTAAFITGGLIPQHLRGTTNDALFYITDWYPTFSNLAGVDPTDNWTDPSTSMTHPIDGVDVWPSLMAGTTPSTPTVRQYLPTTERSLLWDDGLGHMWKLIVDEKQANRFYSNGSQYMDPSHPCLNNTDGSPVSGYVQTFDGVDVPPSCTVCSNSTPCLFDVRKDPTELNNLVHTMPELVQEMQTKLATFTYYVPALSPANVACYTCPKNPPQTLWQGFSGPCCKPNTNVTTTN